MYNCMISKRIKKRNKTATTAQKNYNKKKIPHYHLVRCTDMQAPQNKS